MPSSVRTLTTTTSFLIAVPVPSVTAFAALRRSTESATASTDLTAMPSALIVPPLHPGCAPWRGLAGTSYLEGYTGRSRAAIDGNAAVQQPERSGDIAGRLGAL